MITEKEIQEIIGRLQGCRPVVKKVNFPDLKPPEGLERFRVPLEYLGDVPVNVTVELGSTTLKLREVLQLAEGSVVELDRPAGDLVDVLVGDQLFARGEVVVLGSNFGVRIESIREAHKKRQAGTGNG